MSSKDLWEKEIENVEPLSKRCATVGGGRVHKNFERGLDGTRPISCLSPKTEQQPFDPTLYKKIKSGKINLDAKIDLHGYSEALAFSRLEELIKKLHSQQKRRVLVITGKGRDGGGRIKSMLPQWLSSPRFTPFVSSFTQSSSQHGGHGAWYVLLRRITSR